MAARRRWLPPHLRPSLQPSPIRTNTTTSTGTKTTTGTVIKTDTQTATGTKTFSALATLIATYTGTKTGTLTSSGTKTATQTATGTATWTGTYRGTGTATGTKTFTGTLTGTTTLTGTLTISATGTKTNTATKTVTGTAVGTGTKTTTQTYTAIPTATTTTTTTSTGTATTTLSKTGTVTSTGTGTGVVTVPNPCYGTWAFCDNFETGNGSGWNVRQGPVQNFTVVPDGSKVYRQGDTSASQLYISQAQVGMAWLDSTVEANLKPLSFSSSSATVSLWGRYDATWNADCGYYVSLRGDGKLALGKRVAGVSTAIGSPVAVPGGIATGTWYDVKLDIQGTTLKAYVNNTQLLTQTDSSCTSGSVGVGSTGASFESDDVRVTAPTTNACVQNWRDTTNNQCGAFCTYEATVQHDRAGCGDFLDCYATHGCSPETCGGDDDVCGVHQPGLNTWGTASKEVADQVYKCLGCAGSVNCANPKYYNGTVCADGSPCTWGDTCQNKVCVPDPNRNTQCSAADQCHSAGTCDTGTGICNNPSKPDGTLCDDSSACTPTDRCESGVCTGQNPKICPASDQCHQGVCDPIAAACSDQPKHDGEACNDDDLCTQTDQCHSGTCVGTNPVTCHADACENPGTCDSSTGSCSDPTPRDGIGCNINLRYDGFVEMPDGTLVALFGHDSTATTSFHPNQNQVFLGASTTPVDNPQPAPPYNLVSGIHPGSFMPICTASQTITWTVDGQSKTADCSDQTKKKQGKVIGTGVGVEVPDGNGGTLVVMVKPDLSPYKTVPSDPGKLERDPPDATGVAFKGVLSGQLSVGPSGQAVYTLPIDIPPGIAGMAPNLNLVYSSQGADGVAGQGWALTGLSVIHRCAMTRKQDGRAQPVQMTDTIEATSNWIGFGDGVCLDGKRLFYRRDSNSYEPEFKDFSTITVSGDTFVVKTKSGETRQYGLTNMGRIRSQVQRKRNAMPNPGELATRVWLLERVSDPWGNYYEIHYEYDSTPHATGFLLTEIKYTGHDATGPDDTSTPTFSSVKFTYEDRPDVRDTGVASSYIAGTKRLKTIATDRGTYTLTYLPNSLMQPSRLSQVDYCSAVDSTACVDPLVFDWNVPQTDTPVPQWADFSVYKLPVVQVGPGTQFVDLDADGRPDFVLAVVNYPGPVPLPFLSYRNNGFGQKCVGATCSPSNADSAAWVERPEWALPWGLADGDQNYRGTVFADFDGDGKPDLIADKWGNGKPAVWLNHLTKDGGSWDLAPGFSGDQLQTVLSSFPSEGEFGGWGELNITGTNSYDYTRVIDIDGDGKADLVRAQAVCHDNDEGSGYGCGYKVRVIRSTGSGWIKDTNYETDGGYGSLSGEKSGIKLVDLNRDSLPDIATPENTSVINTGTPDNGSVWDHGYTGLWDPTASGNNIVRYGDFDGDGMYDVISQRAPACSRDGFGGPVHCGSIGTAKLFWARTFEDAINAQTSPADYFAYLDSLSRGQFNLVDLNADGLVDIVVNHTLKLRPLINNGKTLVDPNEYANYGQAEANQFADSNWITPLYPPYGGIDWMTPTLGITNSFDAFFDLDGDGVADHISTETQLGGAISRGAWRNKFQPPVIIHFPNGLAQKSIVSYDVITTASAVNTGIYTDTGTVVSDGPFATRRLNAPLRVVSSISVDNGVTNIQNPTSYQYYDLRMSAKEHDAQGFAKIVATDQITRIATETSFYQHYPFTGKPSKVERYYVDSGRGTKSPITSTSAKYKTDCSYYNSDPPSGSTPDGKTSLFVSVDQINDIAFQQPVTPVSFSSDAPKVPALTTLTWTTYDAIGNAKYLGVLVVTEDAKQKYIDAYLKETTNTFGEPGSDYESKGKVTKTVVKTTQVLSSYGQKPPPPAITHETDFDYEQTDAMPLVKKVVEPGSDVPTKVQTAYKYDSYGNLTTTTVCGTDFDNCKAGAAGPSSLPYRTTVTSYDPVDFNPAPAGTPCRVTTPPYGYGRFPVKTTAVGDPTHDVPDHVTYTAYDPLFGTVIQSSDPNGVQSYTVLDPLGRVSQQIGRCGYMKDGDLKELVTSISRIVPSAPSNPLTKLITITQPPDRHMTWVGSDALGRTVQTSLITWAR